MLSLHVKINDTPYNILLWDRPVKHIGKTLKDCKIIELYMKGMEKGEKNMHKETTISHLVLQEFSDNIHGIM